MGERERPADPVDRRIAAALVLHPRASWGLIAQVLGIPESTVARRGARLCSRGVVKVLGTLDVIAAGRGTPVLMRVSCTPGTAPTVAAELAGRSEVWMAHLLSGTVDCMAEVVIADSGQLAELAYERLGGMQGVTGSSSHVVIRRFATAHGWDSGVLGQDAVRRLRGSRADRWDHSEQAGQVGTLTEVDEEIVAALQADGRMRWVDVAARAGVMERTARRRADELMHRGLLRMRAVVDPGLFGLAVRALLWVRIDPSRLTTVGQALAGHSSVLLLAATTGEFNLCGEIAVRDYAQLYEFLTTVLGALPGVRDIDLTLELRTLKRAGELTKEQT
ncbi:Lrp/AsnC family transcriptional regulator [Sciscionella sediminilitoris]|uniref:Lrp/AsnC family transcriptional regulator n=1 Tax=Sciscionella sediminilitoris TaxID=1445613 RepID=UPI0018D1D164|nr:Lrp/AsnC family transcriptional regulator [Sciscionella sp. SE31]